MTILMRVMHRRTGFRPRRGRGRIGRYFFDRPLPDAAFQISPTYLSGLRPSRKHGVLTTRRIQPLAEGILRPSFDRPNILDPDLFRDNLTEMIGGLGVKEGLAAVLLPDLSVRVFILAADSLPPTEKEREEFVRWRLGKTVPLPYEDIRIDFQVSRDSGPPRVICAVGRESVIREYENLFMSSGMKVGTVTIPSLCLVNLLGGPGESDGIILNLEEDSLSFLAVAESGWSLFRQKGVTPEDRQSSSLDEKIGQVVKEVENTAFFLEDKEKRKVTRLWLRSALPGSPEEVAGALRRKLSLTVEGIETLLPQDWDAGEKHILAPLIGLIS